MGRATRGELKPAMIRHTFSIPEGWDAIEGHYGDLCQEVLVLTHPDWRASPDQRGRGDASRPQVYVARSDYPVTPSEDDMSVALDDVRDKPGVRLVSSGQSDLPHGIVFTSASEALRFPKAPGFGTFERVERTHTFVAGGRRFHVGASAGAEGWEDGCLLRFVEAVEQDVARENA
jgi:hypothetical protein